MLGGRIITKECQKHINVPLSVLSGSYKIKFIAFWKTININTAFICIKDYLFPPPQIKLFIQ